VNILTSTISDKLDKVFEDFEDEFGFGPCGAFTALKREQGWGDVAVCVAHAGDTKFTHFVIVDGGIIDLANPLDEPLTFTDLDVLDADEMPELCNEKTVEWLRQRNV